MDYIWHYSSPLGGITLASDREALTGLWFDGQKYFASTLLSPWKEQTLPIFQEAVHWLDLYFGGAIPDFSPGFHLRGTPFQCAVWQSLLEIPYGHTATYGELARRTAARLQRNESARAVGNAVSRNPLSILLPCHRVVGSNGSLTGYAGGIERKRWLLQLEKTHTPPTFPSV